MRFGHIRVEAGEGLLEVPDSGAKRSGLTFCTPISAIGVIWITGKELQLPSNLKSITKRRTQPELFVFEGGPARARARRRGSRRVCDVRTQFFDRFRQGSDSDSFPAATADGDPYRPTVQASMAEACGDDIEWGEEAVVDLSSLLRGLSWALAMEGAMALLLIAGWHLWRMALPH